MSVEGEYIWKTCIRMRSTNFLERCHFPSWDPFSKCHWDFSLNQKKVWIPGELRFSPLKSLSVSLCEQVSRADNLKLGQAIAQLTNLSATVLAFDISIQSYK